MKIPFFDLRRQYAIIQDQVERDVISCMASCGYIEGEAVKQLEADLETYLGVRHVITCGNGTDALQISLKALGVKPGDEVITTAFSFFATAESIAAIGAVPVFADINYEDYNIDPQSIEKRITPKTKAILPVHIFGRPANMKEINDIAAKHSLFVLEDACQAIGSELEGTKAGGLGDIAAFSFYPTKNLGAFGDGGMITTNSDDLATRCRAIKAHAGGKTGYDAAVSMGINIGGFVDTNEKGSELYDPYKYYNYIVGENSRLDSMQAAVLNVKLRLLNNLNQRRADIATRYNEAFKELPIHLPPASDNDIKNCWHQYAVLTERKNELIEFLTQQGIGVGAFYPVPLHLQKAFYTLGYASGDLPVSERVCSESVCLPIFPELENEEIEYIIEAVKRFFG